LSNCVKFPSMMKPPDQPVKVKTGSTTIAT
jgi:hypothetical protein